MRGVEAHDVGACTSLEACDRLRERLGAAGRARVVPRYSVERLVDDIDLLYRSLLASAGARP